MTLTFHLIAHRYNQLLAERARTPAGSGFLLIPHKTPIGGREDIGTLRAIATEDNFP
jgi:hypothetical protein